MVSIRTPKEKKDSYSKHFIEFQSSLIETINHVTTERYSATEAFDALIESRNLFTRVNKDHYQLSVNWQIRNEMRSITITLIKPNIIHFDDTKRFMTICVENKKLLINKYKSKWNDDDLKEIVSTFNQIFRVRNFTLKDDHGKEFSVKLPKKRHHYFSTDQFNELIEKYKISSFSYRIENIILNNSSRKDNKYIFKIDWPDKKKQVHQLKICFSRTNKLFPPIGEESGFSWVLTEDTLLKHFPEYNNHGIKSGQYYFSTTVYEILPGSEDKILSEWMSSDGQFGELRDLHKGKRMSGSDVMHFSEYLDGIFRIKYKFICDESKLISSDDSIRIPLRLISSIATGKTFYQRFSGVKLFECKNFKTSHDGIINQNNATRERALMELQQLPLHKWYEFLDANQKLILLRLYESNFKIEGSIRQSLRFKLFSSLYNPLSETKATLQDLTKHIYEKANRSKCITQDLADLVAILCKNRGIHSSEEIVIPNKKDPDYYVSSRVHTLLWESYFWIKTQPEEKKESAEFKKSL